MRVTNSMLVGNYLSDLNTNMTKLSKLQKQMTNGRKYASISDDPVGAIYAMQANFRLNRLERYQKSVEMTQNWLTQAETSVMELNEVYKSAYETVIQATTNVKTDADRANMANYVKELRDQVLQTLNTSLGDRYIFAGYNTTGSYPGGQLETPFKVDDNGHIFLNGFDLTAYDSSYDPAADTAYDPAYVVVPDTDPAYDAAKDAAAARKADYDTYNKLQTEMKQFWVGNGLLMDVQINGVDLVGTGQDNLYSMLDNLYNLLSGDKTLDNMVIELKENYIKPLQEKQSDLLAVAASIGGRANRLEMMADRYEQDYINYTQMKSDAQDADEAELIMLYKMAESVYKAALSSGSFIIQQTLMDFLR